MTKPFKILTAILPLYDIGCSTSAMANAPATESSSFKGQSKDFLYNLWAQGIDYVPDMRLTDNWVVEQVEGVPLKPASFMKGLPMLELSARERRLNGHDGCNRIGGAFTTKRNTITFKKLMSTKMFCQTPEGTPDIGALLAEKTYDFEFGSNRLYLKKDNKIILTLKHVD